MKQICIFFIGALILIISCKKKENALTGPSIYNFKVVDEYNNNPIPNCVVILQQEESPFSIHIDTIGYTNLNGEFQYDNQYDSQYASSTDDYYHHYKIYFKNTNYFNSDFTVLSLTHETNDYLISMNKKTVLGLKIRQINPTPPSCISGTAAYFLWFNFNHLDLGSGHIVADSMSNIIYYNYFTLLPSNKTITVSWSTSCGYDTIYTQSQQDITTGYNDTTYFYIDY